MEKRFGYKGVTRLLLALLLGLTLGHFAQSAQAADLYVDGSCVDSEPDGRCDGTTDGFKTITAALAVATTGDIIHVAAGTYAEVLTITTDGVSLVGESEATVIIDATASTGYHLTVSADDVTLQNFTLLGSAAGSYGLKADGDGGSDTAHQNLVLENVTVDGSLRTGVDLNGLVGVTLSGVTVRNVPSGNGVALTDVSNAVLTDITTRDNAWGGVALYTYGRYFPGGSDTITVTNLDANEANPLYVELGNYSDPASPYPLTNLSAPQFTHTARNATFRAGGENFVYYHESAAEAVAFALALPTPRDSVVNRAADGRFLVADGMTIQAAIEWAAPGETIDVYPGNYSEAAGPKEYYGAVYDGSSCGGFALFVDKAGLTIQGVDAAGTPIEDAGAVLAEVEAGAHTCFGAAHMIYADDVTLTGLSVLGDRAAGYINKTVEVVGNNLTVRDCRVDGGYDAGGDYYGAALYFGDETYAHGLSESAHIVQLTVDGNELVGSLTITNGTGDTASPALAITNNTFSASDKGVNIRGESEIAWRNLPCGMPQISGNAFEAISVANVYVDGENSGTLDWDAVLADNSFARNVLLLTPAGELREDSFSVPYPSYCGKPEGEVCWTEHRAYLSTRIQSESERAQSGDTVRVWAGTYVEQVLVNTDLTLEGLDAPIVVAPAAPAAFGLPESTRLWEPVILVFGGEMDESGTISGTAQVAASVSGLVVDGNDRPPTSGRRSAGILLRNATGSVANNTIQNMHIGTAETFGIMVHGDSDLTIAGNTISGYARGGIGANGDLGPLPDPAVLIQGNTVSGPGLGAPVTWAPNGIQIGWGGTGTIKANAVTGNGWPGDEWAGSGIIIAGSDGVVIEQNTVTYNENAISVTGDNWFGSEDVAIGTVIQKNTITHNSYGISLQDRVADTQILANEISYNTEVGVELTFYDGVPPTGSEIHNNRIMENCDHNADPACWGTALVSDTGVPRVNAQYNWWGHETGPHHHWDNPVGLGDQVIGDVDFYPWLYTPFIPELDVRAMLFLPLVAGGGS